MNHTITAIAFSAATALAPIVAATGSAGAATPVRYANCTALNHVYRHGVAYSKTTKDRVRSHTHPAVGMYVNTALYTANAKWLDRDHDYIDCEKV